MMKTLAALVTLLGTAVQLTAQLPVPVGQQALFTVSGVVTGADGAAAAGVTISVVSGQSGTTRETVTNETGAYTIPNLPAATYTVTATLPGFSVQRKQVVLGAPGRGGPIPTLTKVDFRFGVLATAPVPVAEPAHAVTAGTKQAVKKTFGDDLALIAWLNQEALKGQRLIAVTPLQNQTSLFIFATVSPENNSVEAFTVNGPLDETGLTARLGQYQSKTFLGVHLISASSYLILFR
jgi:hypothetical protein